MDYPTLANEVTTDPRAVGYATMPQDQKAAALNNPVIPVTEPVSSSRLLVWGAQNGRLAAINTATGSATASIASIAQAALHIIQRSDTEFDYNDPAQALMPAALVQSNVITQADADALHALSQVNQSWAEIHWGRDVTLLDLRIAGVS